MTGIAYNADLASGWFHPLTFERDANPNGLSPEVRYADGGSAVTLAVRAGAYPFATRGEPGKCDRCELRDPVLPMAVESWHAFSMRIPADFPKVDARFVAAQIKSTEYERPIFALRIRKRTLFATVHRAPHDVEIGRHWPPPVAGEWQDFLLHVGPEIVELTINGQRIAEANMIFGHAGFRRLKIGPYRDKDPVWGSAPAALEFRGVRRGATREDVEKDACLAA